MKFLIAINFFLVSFGSYGQVGEIEINSVSNFEDLIKKVLVSNCNVVKNIEFSGYSKSIGYFTNGHSALGINSGVILSTGNINEIVLDSLNDNDIQASYISTSWWNKGDIDLDNITGNHTFDACAIEFDFIPKQDSVKLKYVFASEEYPEWVHTGYNDAFAFLLSGPGIEGVKNLALVPESKDFVSINTINSDDNSQFYIDNNFYSNVAFDGYTIPLKAVHKVIPGETYHLKVVVADVNDRYYDSGVFLESGSFNNTENEYVIYKKDDGYRDCEDGKFVIMRAESSEFRDTVIINYESNLTEGIDFDFSMKEVIFEPSDFSKEIVLTSYLNNNESGEIIVSINKTECDKESNDSIKLFDKILKVNGTIITGGVFAKGMMKVYNFDGNEKLNLIDSFTVNNGFYSIDIKQDSTYMLFVPNENSDYYPQYMDGGLYPGENNIISNECGESVKNIILNKKISYGDSAKYILYSGTILVENITSKTDGNKVAKPNTIVYLITEYGSVVDFTTTDENGDFSFLIDPNENYKISINENLYDNSEYLFYEGFHKKYAYLITQDEFIYEGSIEKRENTENQFFVIYPNPVKKGNLISIKTNNSLFSYSIFNVQGKLIATEKNSSKHYLSTSKLDSGLYLIKVESGNSLSNLRLIIK